MLMHLPLDPYQESYKQCLFYGWGNRCQRVAEAGPGGGPRREGFPCALPQGQRALWRRKLPGGCVLHPDFSVPPEFKHGETIFQWQWKLTQKNKYHIFQLNGKKLEYAWAAVVGSPLCKTDITDQRVRGRQKWQWPKTMSLTDHDGLKKTLNKERQLYHFGRQNIIGKTTRIVISYTLSFIKKGKLLNFTVKHQVLGLT